MHVFGSTYKNIPLKNSDYVVMFPHFVASDNEY